MINSVKVSSHQGLNKDISNLDWHNYKLYPFLLQEALYMVGSRENELYSEIRSNDVTKSKLSFIKIKRIVNAIRYEGYTQNISIPLKNPERKIFSKQRKNCLDKLLFQPMTMVLDSAYKKYQTIGTTDIYDKRWNTYSSIHSALLAIEYQWQCYASILEGRIPSLLHPEMLMRILRNKIQDVSFLHLLRQLLHQNILRLEPGHVFLRQSYSNKLGILLLNLYTIECEKFFLLEIPSFLHKNQGFNTMPNDDLSCLKKMKIWNPLVVSSKHLLTQGSNSINTKFAQMKNHTFDTLYATDSITYKYIRSKNIWLLNIQAKKDVINLLQKGYLKFLQNRMGYISQSNQLKSSLVESSLIFLGYILQFKIKQIFVQIYVNFSILRICFKMKCIAIANPLFLIIRILARYRFCTYFGYPISKSGWATWSDTIIIDRFKRIRDSLVGYYSGSINQNNLSRIHHILHYSCAKTLACKHKTNLRKIWKKYGNNLSIQYKSYKNRIYFHIIGKYKDVDSRRNVRFWNLQFKEPDPISILLENTYRFQK